MRSSTFAVQRLLGMLATLLVTSFIVFGSLYVAPGSPITFLTEGHSVSAAARAELTQQYGLNRPFIVQYWHWLTGVLQGNFGDSIIYHTSASSLLGTRAANTLFLMGYAGAMIIVFGLITGTLAALRPGRTDATLMTAATVGLAIPTFVAAVVLILIFGVRLGWFPVYGSGSGLFGRLQHLTLPSIALAISSIAYVARLTRAAVRTEQASDHVQTAVSRGLPSGLLIRRHVIRNAMIPLVTVASLAVGSLIAGTVIVEQAFQLNGLGTLLVSSVEEKDFPVVQAICLIFVVAFVVLNTAVDLLYYALDPRLSRSRKRR